LRAASALELALWERLATPASVEVLQGEAHPRATLETLLLAGALEYA